MRTPTAGCSARAKSSTSMKHLRPRNEIVGWPSPYREPNSASTSEECSTLPSHRASRIAIATERDWTRNSRLCHESKRQGQGTHK